MPDAKEMAEDYISAYRDALHELRWSIETSPHQPVFDANEAAHDIAMEYVRMAAEERRNATETESS